MLVLYTRYKPNDDWLQANGKLNPQLFWDDDLHLSKIGYQKFATSLFNFISLCNTSRSTSFDLIKAISHFLHCQEPTSTFQPRKSSFTINTITTTIFIIIIIFNFSITIIIIIIISSSPLSLNAPLSSSSSVLFYISSTSEVCVLPSYLNSSVFFLTTCFFLFSGFRCNILLTNIYIDVW